MRISQLYLFERSHFHLGQRGVSLIEVLVAVVVVAIGLLGAANLQVRALQAQQYSYSGTVANLIAKDAKERMWYLMVEDLSEDGSGVYRNCSYLSDQNDTSVIEAKINSDWGLALPGLDVSVLSGSEIFSESGCAFIVRVVWLDSRFGWIEGGEDAPDEMFNEFKYYVRLPGIENGSNGE